MINKAGYTLIELLVAIGIMGLMFAVGAPAFSKFGDRVDFEQKADEIREAMKQVYSYSQNPENNQIYKYGLEFAADKVTFKSYTCNTYDSDGNCTEESPTTKKEIKLLRGQVFYSPNPLNPDNYTDASFVCYTDLDKTCDIYNYNRETFELADNNVAVEKGKAVFSVRKAPYSVLVQYQSLN